MTRDTIEYDVGGHALDAVVARPEGDGPRPAVMVCHAWGGRDAFAEDKARRLAELGYVGAAIDVYGVGKRASDRSSAEALMTSLLREPAVLRERLDAAYRAVRAQDGVDPDRVAAIGYCFGGMCSLLMARMGLPLRGVVSFHGLLKLGEKLDATPRAKMLVLHGQDDPMAPPAEIGPFAEEMKRIGADWELHAYPGVMHAFTNPKADNPDFGTVYDEGADRRSWAAMKRFLGDALG